MGVVTETTEKRLYNDGNTCNNPTSADPNSYLYLVQPEREDCRLSTFLQYPQSSSALPNRLAAAGFYYTGHTDVVRCFSCGQCAENMTRNDDPNDIRFHEPNCELANGNDARNVPSSAHSHEFSRLNSLFLTRGQHPIDHSDQNVAARDGDQAGPSSRRSPHRNSSSSTGSSNVQPRRGSECLPSGNQVNQSQQASVNRTAFPCQNPCNRHMQNLRNRVDSFQNGETRWPRERIIASPRDIAAAGFFFMGQGDRVQCWYCGGALENWEVEDDPWTEHAKWFPNCEFLLREKGLDFVHGVVSRFPNLPRQSIIRPVNDTPPVPRPISTRSTVLVYPGEAFQQELAPGILVSSGGMHIQVTRNGTSATIRGPRRNTRSHHRANRLQQPQFFDPQRNAGRHEQTVNEAMANSPMVTNARVMGFTDDVIRLVLLSKCEQSNRMYENFEEMLEALVRYQEESERMGNQAQVQHPAGGNDQGAASGEDTPAQVELRRLEESRSCKLCHRERASVVMMPCAHLAVCVNCSQQTIRICPVCRRVVTENIPSFLS